ncbi:DUF92 domain-containing protein [Chitinophaga silvatica]|uniref:DUF92 domain-containing protein n=1 Tax=Chitinophaga silvatica TaxID=2282649 RepID=A0A3E1Y6Z2_9BACT|nr:DUF92 domain-containing protein [Chitinophaga silvatica]RFS20714.1 DUF92 domain-containing protein [Chitinophaga silvatica]
MSVTNILCLLLIIIGVFLSVKTGKLSLRAALSGGLIGLLLLLGAGVGGVVLLGVFFVLGVLATSHQKEQKNTVSEERTPQQVLANGGVAGLMGALAWLHSHNPSTYILMMAASLAAATADTLSSELGMVYGKRTFNILTFKNEPKGLDGVISIEGTIIGVIGAVIIALVYGAFYGFGANCYIIVLAGFFGNIVDSVLGATLERKGYITNDMVNLGNTLAAALLAGWL